MSEDDFPLTFGEALRAMIDGEVLMDSKMQTPTRFNVEKQQFEFYKNYEWKEWSIKCIDRRRQRWRAMDFVEEYSLTFAEAFKHMLEGQKAICRNDPYRIIGFNGQCFTVRNTAYTTFTGEAPTEITIPMQMDYKWKVVEE